MLPHDTPSFAQLMATHPHWFAVPPPPQVDGGAHSPQSIASEQPSEIHPHEAPSCVQTLGVHDSVPHWLSPPPPHVCPAGHDPHVTFPPHPSGADPHTASSCAQVLGTQAAASAFAPSSPPASPS